MKKILVSGLDDPPGGKYRLMVLDNVPKTWVTFFMDSKNSMGIISHVDLVICCHPKLLRLIYGREKKDDRWQHKIRGWWKFDPDSNIWCYSTTKQTLAHDILTITEQLP